MEILTPILIGFFSSFVASIGFYLLLYRLRPNIKISPKIAKVPNGNDFVIKVINKSKRDAVEVRAKLFKMKPVNVPNGIIWRRTEIPLRKGYLFLLKRYDKNDKEANYAFRFTTKENLEDIWDDDNQYLLFQVYAKDELSGFGKVFSQKYYRKNSSIVEGRFKTGDTFEIE